MLYQDIMYHVALLNIVMNKYMTTRKLNLEIILVDLTFCQNKKDILKFKKKKVLVTFFIKDTINIAEEQTLKMVG